VVFEIFLKEEENLYTSIALVHVSEAIEAVQGIYIRQGPKERRNSIKEQNSYIP
jgi:hypothetical protein